MHKNMFFPVMILNNKQKMQCSMHGVMSRGLIMGTRQIFRSLFAVRVTIYKL